MNYLKLSVQLPTTVDWWNRGCLVVGSWDESVVLVSEVGQKISSLSIKFNCLVVLSIDLIQDFLDVAQDLEGLVKSILGQVMVRKGLLVEVEIVRVLGDDLAVADSSEELVDVRLKL